MVGSLEPMIGKNAKLAKEILYKKMKVMIKNDEKREERRKIALAIIGNIQNNV